MKVRLTRKLAERIDGVDLQGREVGDVLDLSSHEARVLIAEGWATVDRRYHSAPSSLRRRANDTAGNERL